MPDFSGKWTCHFTYFFGSRYDDRGQMDFTGHITGDQIKDAPYVTQPDSTGHTDKYSVTGSITQIDGRWVLKLDRNDGLAQYFGFLVEDTANRMTFVVLKHVVQPLNSAKRAKSKTLFDQVDEPWVITKP